MFSLHNLKESWDDGAITAAFAQTWAHSGRIALTPTSVVVEGFSSVLWCLLLNVPAFLTHRPDASLIWMKVLSAWFAALSLLVLYAISRQQFVARSSAAAAVLLLAFSFTVTNEIGTGMEMNLAAFLLLLLFYVLTRRQDRGRVLYATILGWLLLLTRFESPFQLVLLAAGLLYAAYRRPTKIPLPGTVLRRMPRNARPKDIYLTAAWIVFGFLLIEMWRHHTFGFWMPNTVYAKTHFPYSKPPHSVAALVTRWNAFRVPFTVLPIPFAVAALAAFFALGRKQPCPTQLTSMHPAIWTLAAGCFLLGGLIGENVGYPGRMVGMMVPFLILALVGFCADATRGRHALTGLLASLVLLQGMLWLWCFHHPYSIVSMQTIEPIGKGADSIRVALHKQNLSVMISDVGASTLCCEKLTVVDSALLANPVLSHTGWGGFNDQFRAVNPEVVETHNVWAAESHIYEQGLLDRYSIVTSHGIRFFVRNDLYRQLLAEHAGPVMPLASVPACISLYPFNSAGDVAYSLTRQTCLVLNRTDLL